MFLEIIRVLNIDKNKYSFLLEYLMVKGNNKKQEASASEDVPQEGKDVLSKGKDVPSGDKEFEELEERVEKEEEEEDLEELSKFLGGGEIVEIAPGAKTVLESDEELPVQDLEEDMSAVSSKSDEEVKEIKYDQPYKELAGEKYKVIQDSDGGELDLSRQHFSSFQEAQRGVIQPARISRDIHFRGVDAGIRKQSEEDLGASQRDYATSSEIESKRETTEESRVKKYKRG